MAANDAFLVDNKEFVQARSGDHGAHTGNRYDDLEDFELAEEGFDVTERSINLIVLRKPAMSFPASMPILPLNYTINSADPPTLTEFYAAAQCHFLYQSRLMQHDGMRQAVAIRPPRRAGTAHQSLTQHSHQHAIPAYDGTQ